jgi:biotin-dependent carboxylase-like uncharacterized protein
MNGIRIVEPGALATIQDGGRFGFQRYGVAVCGALDPIALRAANALAGNAPLAGAVECMLLGPTLCVEVDQCLVAVAGGDADIRIIDRFGITRRASSRSSFHVSRGEQVKIGRIFGSSVLYIAFAGGLNVPPVMGSVSTDTRAGLGGLNGNALGVGDLIPLSPSEDDRDDQTIDMYFEPDTDVRVVLGPQEDYFASEQIDAFLSSRYTIENTSNRMGLALLGAPIVHKGRFDIISDAIAHGSIQVPGNGQPIVLLNDRQTTGGYPKIATVITADLPAVGRCRAGTSLQFRLVTMREARDAAAEMRAMIENLSTKLRPAGSGTMDDTAYRDRLLAHNLISGVVDARG